MTPWEIHGQELNNCNCDAGCPCQFMSRPTYGNCEFVGAFRWESGFYGDIGLGGTVTAMLVQFPGPIHEGNGTIQLVIDDSASPAQRDALQRIMSGQDTREMATMFWMLAAMCSTKLETLFKPITLEIDMENRTGRCTIPGVVEMLTYPIRNPVTGEPHRARIELPHGFEFRVSEVAHGTTQTSGDIRMGEMKDRHAYITDIHMSNDGVLEAA
ncbi:DUF1326 domain-containing protein [Poseidonocella sp. HB161398]|uniref:DUF1326 domain-containing protein n=1 Tax=Poseidonocella sp. HB161398 TaxID=2320855 RepID=UPI001109F8B1|nr:DUF1326 domain-containing protein [Poseidonocella sp. HB161398]